MLRLFINAIEIVGAPRRSARKSLTIGRIGESWPRLLSGCCHQINAGPRSPIPPGSSNRGGCAFSKGTLPALVEPLRPSALRTGRRGEHQRLRA